MTETPTTPSPVAPRVAPQPEAPKAAPATAPHAGFLVRFSKLQRLEHVTVMSVFMLLVITGMPQKFFESGWAQSTVNLLGGVAVTRFIHRWCGILFSALVAIHFARLVWGGITRKGALTIVPTRKDFQDAVVTLKYYLGLSETQVRFDRFDYRQKFEYWGLVMGAVIMVCTGFILYLPALVTRLLPGELIPAAKVAHSNEGLMAFLVVILWHVYNAHLNPDVFPFDTTIFTGKISRERMEHEHPLELERLEAAQPKKAAAPLAPKPPEA